MTDKQIQELTQEAMAALITYCAEDYDIDSYSAVGLTIEIMNMIDDADYVTMTIKVINPLRLAFEALALEPDTLVECAELLDLIDRIKEAVGLCPEYFTAELIGNDDRKSYDILGIFHEDGDANIEMIDYVYGASEMDEADVRAMKTIAIRNYIARQ